MQRARALREEVQFVSMSDLFLAGIVVGMVIMILLYEVVYPRISREIAVRRELARRGPGIHAGR